MRDERAARVARVRRQVIAHEIVRVQVLAARDLACHVADRRAVAQHLVVRGERRARDLVAELDRLREHDALVLPSVWAENAPLVIVEAAMIGLPVLVHDIGSLSSFGDEIGNKIRYARNGASLAHALDALRAHLREPRRRYDWSLYTRRHYADRLAALLELSAREARELAPQCD